MPLDEPYLTSDAHWKRLFRAFKQVRGSETDLALSAELRMAEHKLRLAYTLNDYPEEPIK